MTQNGLRPVSLLKRMRDARSTRLALGLSLAQMGERLGQAHPNPVYRRPSTPRSGAGFARVEGVANGGHGGQPFAKQTISMWEHRGHQRKYRMTDDTREAYARIVSELIAQATAGRVWVQARLGARTWTFQACANCVDCGQPFRLPRSNVKRCRQCRR